jgi:hypothetical protein
MEHVFSEPCFFTGKRGQNLLECSKSICLFLQLITKNQKTIFPPSDLSLLRHCTPHKAYASFYQSESTKLTGCTFFFC